MSGYAIPPPRREAKVRRKDRDLEALYLKVTGHSWQEIADHEGLSGDPKKAVRAVKRAVANVTRWALDEERQLEYQSLEILENQIWEEIRAELPKLTNPRGVVLDPDSGDAVRDRRYRLETYDRLMRVKERKAKLRGLDAPTRQEVITIDKVDSEIRKLEAEIAAMGKEDKLAHD